MLYILEQGANSHVLADSSRYAVDPHKWPYESEKLVGVAVPIRGWLLPGTKGRIMHENGHINEVPTLMKSKFAIPTSFMPKGGCCYSRAKSCYI